MKILVKLTHERYPNVDEQSFLVEKSKIINSTIKDFYSINEVIG